MTLPWEGIAVVCLLFGGIVGGIAGYCEGYADGLRFALNKFRAG